MKGGERGEEKRRERKKKSLFQTLGTGLLKASSWPQRLEGMTGHS